jgi:hypothetical protein
VEEVRMMANNGTAEQGARRMEEGHTDTDTLEKPSLMKLRKELMFVDKGNSMAESTGKKDRYPKSMDADCSMNYNRNLSEN